MYVCVCMYVYGKILCKHIIIFLHTYIDQLFEFNILSK